MFHGYCSTVKQSFFSGGRCSVTAADTPKQSDLNDAVATVRTPAEIGTFKIKTEWT